MFYYKSRLTNQSNACMTQHFVHNEVINESLLPIDNAHV